MQSTGSGTSVSQVAVGSQALGNSAGNNNVGIGASSGRLLQTGSFNTFLGDTTGVVVGAGAINNATAIGKNATVGASNSMVLGGTGVDAVNVGIGMNVPTNTLHVKPLLTFDPLRVEGVKPSTAVTDKTLVIDTNGVVKTALNSQSVFGGYLLANTTYNFTVTKIIVTNEIIDMGSEYNTTTGVFTPTVSGVYEYELNVTCNNSGFTAGAARGIIGFVNATTNQWVGRNNFEANTDDRTFYNKGVASLVAGQGYYFGIASPFGATGNVVANPTGSSGTGIGTYFSVKKIQ